MKPYQLPAESGSPGYRSEVFRSLLIHSHHATRLAGLPVEHEAIADFVLGLLYEHRAVTYEYDSPVLSAKQKNRLIMDHEAEKFASDVAAAVIRNHDPEYFTVVQTARAMKVNPLDLEPLDGLLRVEQAEILKVTPRTVSNLRKEVIRMRREPGRRDFWHRVRAARARIDARKARIARLRALKAKKARAVKRKMDAWHRTGKRLYDCTLEEFIVRHAQKEAQRKAQQAYERSKLPDISYLLGDVARC